MADPQPTFAAPARREGQTPIEHPATSLAGPLWLMLAGLIIAIALGYWIAGTAPDFDDLALGDATKSVYGSYAGDKIFCGSIDEAPECLVPAKKRALPHQLLWLGNSQLHAINQPRATDETAPVLLARSQRPRGVEVQAMSFPNASLAELYLAYLFQKQQRRIDMLVVPLFLDDTRESEVRDMLASVASDKAIAGALAASPAGQRLAARLPAKAKDAAGASSEDRSLQARSENAITQALEACCGFQTMREKARGQISIQIYLLRNWLFNVNAQTVRPIIANSYELNLGALDAMLADAAASGTRALVYLPPLRQDVKSPYAPADYARFITDTKAIAARHGATWLGIDGIVPGPLWGTKAATVAGGTSELDFMHFQEPGHIAVAKAIRPQVEAVLK